MKFRILVTYQQQGRTYQGAKNVANAPNRNGVIRALKNQETFTDFFSDDALMGPNAPLYWILIGIIFICALMPILAISDWEQTRDLEVQCKEWVGIQYVFDDPWCYRMIDGKLQYVDIDRENAIKEYEERNQ